MNRVAKVHYNSDHERTGISVNAAHSADVKARFDVDGSTAYLTSVEPVEGVNCVYGDNLQYVMDYVSLLPFVDEVLLDKYDEDKIKP